MKKQKMEFRKKLFLNKEIVTLLDGNRKDLIKGGASRDCLVTQIPRLCQGQTVEYGCTTQSLGIACTVIDCI